MISSHCALNLSPQLRSCILRIEKQLSARENKAKSWVLALNVPATRQAVPGQRQELRAVRRDRLDVPDASSDREGMSRSVKARWGMWELRDCCSGSGYVTAGGGRFCATPRWLRAAKARHDTKQPERSLL